MLTVAYADIYRYSLPDGHRFPMQKYPMLAASLVEQSIVSTEHFFAPTPLSVDEILTTHSRTYWQDLAEQTLCAKAARAIGFPMTAELVERERVICQGTYQCALYAKQYGVSLNIAGGTHHAFADHGEGFCVLNDLAIASNLLLARQQARQILIVDLDVHQGNGTASLMTHEPRVFTFSMHGAKNYPFRKQASDLDIDLPDGTDDDGYLAILSEVLPTLIAKVQPDMLLYQAGVDVLATDKLGKLSLTLEGCAQRDRLVFSHARAQGIPVAVVMGGGYSPDINTVVAAHRNTFDMAKKVFG